MDVEIVHLPSRFLFLSLSFSLSVSLTLFHTVLTEVGCEVSSSRDQLLDFLTTLMLGDELAAEYTLLHLLSRV